VKYACEVVIDLPRERVIELFDDPDNLAKWQPGLKSFEPLSGEPGRPGAKSRLLFDEKGRKIEMIETVTVRDLPDEFSGTYEAKGVMNWVTNHFVAISPKKTRWVVETEFQFSGLMRLMAPFMRGAFPKQTQQLMQSFKDFAEAS